MANLIDRAEVARRLGMSLERLYHRLPALRAHPVNPFPGPVLGNMRGARWDAAAVDRWIAAGGEHATRPPAAPTAPALAATSSADFDEAHWAAELDRRAAAAAAE